MDPWRVRSLGCLLFLTMAGSVLAPSLEAAGAPRVSASALMPPGIRGWTQVDIVLDAGPEPWRGIVTVGARTAKAQVKLALPAHGQRVVALPFWLDGGESAPEVWIDGVPSGRVMLASAQDHPARILMADGDRQASGPGAASVAAPLGRLPETWRAYEPFDLVLLPPGGDAALRPAQAAALARWVQWGGAVGLLSAEREPPVARAAGAGLAILAPSSAEASGLYARWKRVGGSGADLSRRLLEGWEDPRHSDAAWIIPAGRTGASLGITVAGYLGLLSVAALVLFRHPGTRRLGLQVAVALIGLGSLATWGIARAAAPSFLEVREVTLVIVQPDGSPAHLSAVVRTQAHRSGVSPLVPQGQMPLLYEVEVSRGAPNPGRAVRLDAEHGVWERSWALGEMALLRVDQLGPDLGIRIGRGGGGGTWELENQGRHTLRRLALVGEDGGLRVLPDLTPGGRVRIEPGAPGPSLGGEAAVFWRSILPGQQAWVGHGPALLATLDPPLRPLEFPGGTTRTVSQSHLVLALPAPGQRP